MPNGWRQWYTLQDCEHWVLNGPPWLQTVWSCNLLETPYAPIWKILSVKVHSDKIINNTWETSAWMFEIVQHFLGIRQCPKSDKSNTNALSFYTGFLSLHFGNIIWFFLFVKSQGIGRISTATAIARAANNSASARFHLLSRAKLCRMRLAIKFCPSWIFSFLIQPSEFRHVISNLDFFYNSIIAAIEKKQLCEIKAGITLVLLFDRKPLCITTSMTLVVEYQI